MSSGKWTQQGVPHKGWQFQSLEDLGDLVGTCEMCETQSIRYVHYMEHPDYDGALGVGCVCAGHMGENYEAAKERESRFQARANKRRRWMRTTWKESRRGNPYMNRNGLNIVIYPSGSRWAYRILDRKTGREWVASGLRSENDAKAAAFECYADLQEQT